MATDKYIESINEIAHSALDADLSVVNYVEAMDAHELKTIFSLARGIKVGPDLEYANRLAGVVGFFPSFSDEERALALAITIDVERRQTVISLMRNCARYDATQALFKGDPSLWGKVRDRELISSESLEFVGDPVYVKSPNGYGYVSSYLPTQLLTWSARELGRKFFVRLDPHRWTKSAPRIVLREIAVRPANPMWATDLRIYRGGKEGARYELQDFAEPTQQNAKEFMDYHLLHARRLEVTADRGHDGRLSMMIEELSAEEERSDIWLGRCIHLDTRNNVGTSIEKCELDHIDLALNVYYGEDMLQRQVDSLDKAKVVDATWRTHLLRYERVPFLSLVEFSKFFFRSSCLTEEWLKGQFPLIGEE